MIRILTTTAILILSLRVSSAGDEQSKFFKQNERPLLVARCGDCRGAKEPEGSLRLTMVEGNGGHVIEEIVA